MRELTYVSHHGCVKHGFTIANYFFDKPINFYSNRHDFEHNAWFAFYHAFRVSLTHKIGKNDFYGNFYPNSLEKNYKLFCKKRILLFVWITKFASYLFWKKIGC